MLDTPISDTLTAEMARELNDKFYSSDPFSYFHSRIDALISWSSGTDADYSAGLGAELLKKLHQPIQTVKQADADARELQVASDAFSLRHHVAESVLRLFVALLHMPAKHDDTTCLWVEIAGDRSDGAALVKQAEGFFDATTWAARLRSMMIPAHVEAGLAKDGVSDQALDVLAQWLGHAAYLLVQDEIDINAANNKAKHGHAVRPRNDERWALSTVRPDENGNLPLSALTGESSIQLIDTPVIESLTVPRQKKRSEEGIELTWIKLDVATILAETELMATVHGALFHVAAARHFEGRTDETPPPYPILRLGPTPDHLLAETVTGMRWPVTNPSDPAYASRPAAFVRREGPIHFRTGTQVRGRIVDG